MVVLAGEGADESFIEGFTVLFVPFDGGYDHLEATRNRERKVKRQRSTWTQSNECCLVGICTYLYVPVQEFTLFNVRSAKCFNSSAQ